MKSKDLLYAKDSDRCLLSYYREYYLNAPFPCHSLDSEGSIVEVNPMWEKTLGYEKSEVVGKSFMNILDTDSVTVFKNNFTVLKKSGEIKNVKLKLFNKAGHYIPVSLNGNTSYNEEGNVKNIHCAFHDISNEIQVINNLRESDGRYKAIFNYGESIMLIIDPSTGSIVDANAAAEKYYGYPLNKLISMNISQINALSISEVHEKMQNAKNKRENYFLFQHRLANGCIRDVEVYSGKIVINNRELLYSIIHDITEGRKNEERLKKAEKIANIGSWEINLNTKEVFVSAGARNIYGIDHQKITIDTLKLFPLSEYRASLNKSMRQLLNDGKSYDVEFKIYRQTDGEIVDIRSIARYRRETNTVFGVIHDITLRKKYEEELRQAKEKAEEADRLKSAFLATVSHELRTPLNSIIGLSDIIDENMGMEEILEMNSIINSSGYNLLEIIDTILDISLVETAKFRINKERFLLSKLFDDINEFVKREAVRNSNISIRYIPHINRKGISIATDYIRVRKVIKNLLNNALKFTEKGFVDYGYLVSNGKIVFYVKDSGVGIPDDKKDIIFESFRQLDETLTRRYEGIGLGLTVCKKISDVLDGDIWVESEEGVGSVFYFKLSDVDIQYM